MTSTTKIWAKLRNRKYRQAFVATQLKRGVPLQIRALRQRLKLTQKQLAARTPDLQQGTISRCEDPDYGELTFNTVLAIANGLDVAFVGKFIPFSELLKWNEDLFEHADEVSTFEEEDAQRAPESVAAMVPRTEGQAPSAQSAGPPGIAQLLPALSSDQQARPSFVVRGQTEPQPDLRSLVGAMP